MQKLYSHIVWFLSLVFIIVLNYLSTTYYETHVYTSFNANNISILLPILTTILFGAFLGIWYLLDQSKAKKNNWKIDTTKLTLIGIPCLIIGFLPFWGYLGIPLPSTLAQILLFASPYLQLILGYTVITSFYK